MLQLGLGIVAWLILAQVAISMLFMLGSFVIGRALERQHYQSILEREARMDYLPVVSLRTLSPEQEAQVIDARLVTGSVVVSVDHFNRFLAGLRLLFGGEVRSYHSMVERGRREAVLRLKESCPEASLIVNTRLETSSVLSRQEQASGCLEVFAYGTALFLEPQA